MIVKRTFGSWVSHPPIHPPFVIVRIGSHLKTMKFHLNIIYSEYSPLLCRIPDKHSEPDPPKLLQSESIRA
jgi:hypothetical protein